MTRPFAARSHCFALPMGARLAAFLSFLAVLAALLAPISMLAEEVRTGQLGGLCRATAPAGTSPDTGSGGAPPARSHCAWCSAAALALPPLPVLTPACVFGFQAIAAAFAAEVVAKVIGLPFSRGPPTSF